MNKIIFDDKSYIEVSKSEQPDKIFITIAAKASDNAYKLIANCVELTKEQLLELVHSIS